MKRVRIVYSGREFTVPGTDGPTVRAAVDAALAGGDPWLPVVSGMGRGADALLLITPGTPIAVIDESSDGDEGTEGSRHIA